MDTVQILHTITEPTRFRLLELLLRRHYCVKALAKKTGISEPAVSQHMKVLKECGVVSGVRLGYQTHYQIDRGLVLSVLNDFFSRFGGQAVDYIGSPTWDCSCEYVAICKRRPPKQTEENL